MKYKGKVYGKINGKYIQLTETVEELKCKIQSQTKEIEELKETIKNQDMIIHSNGRALEENQQLKEKVKMFEICSGNVLQQFGHYEDDHLDHLKQIFKN